MDTVLLFEQLIHVRYRGIFSTSIEFHTYKGSVQGVLFIITIRGDAFFYPLSEHTKGNTPGGNPAKLLTTDSAPPKKLRPSGIALQLLLLTNNRLQHRFFFTGNPRNI
jgi:hypothetical protein